MTRHELSYDSHGINGPDEYRSRIATFAPGPARDKYGPLFEAAPELLAALQSAVNLLSWGEAFNSDLPDATTAEKNAAKKVDEFKAIIARAQGAL